MAGRPGKQAAKNPTRVRAFPCVLIQMGFYAPSEPALPVPVNSPGRFLFAEELAEFSVQIPVLAVAMIGMHIGQRIREVGGRG